MSGLAPRAVQRGPEFRRIAALPWRPVPRQAELDALVSTLTRALRTPWGRQVLRPKQALACAELVRCRGGFFPLMPGAGKTLITYLAPTLLRAVRPLLILPKGLVQETEDKFRDLHEHWIGPAPGAYRMESYAFLSHPNQGVKAEQDEFLARYQPDLIVLDEAHKSKDPQSVAHKRLRRYRQANPGAAFVALTGTPAKSGLENYAAIMEWCLPLGCPAPTPDHYVELQDWIGAIDDKVPDRIGAGALLDFCSPEDRAYAALGPAHELRSARRGFKRRLTCTPGVVSSLGEPFLDVPLTIEPYWPARYDATKEPLFKKLRTLALTPTDDPVPDGMQEWSTARELALDLHYRWDPPAPSAWRDRRRECFTWARKAITHTRVRGVDSWATLVRAVEAGQIKDDGLIARWLEIEPTFVPNPVPVWHSTEALDSAAAWLREHPRGVVWCEHRFFAQRLADTTGLPYFAEHGIDAKTGLFVLSRDNYTPSIPGPCILSWRSNGEGRNLQWWRDQLFLTFPQDPVAAEQTIARLHRPGQTDPVRVYVWIGCYELAAGYWIARESARAIEDREGGAQRILYAREAAPMPTIDQTRARGGFRWTK